MWKSRKPGLETRKNKNIKKQNERKQQNNRYHPKIVQQTKTSKYTQQNKTKQPKIIQTIPNNNQHQTARNNTKQQHTTTNMRQTIMRNNFVTAPIMKTSIYKIDEQRAKFSSISKYYLPGCPDLNRIPKGIPWGRRRADLMTISCCPLGHRVGCSKIKRFCTPRSEPNP